MTRSEQRRRIVRSGAIGFVAGLATLGVVASASPVRGAVASAVGAETAGWEQLLGGGDRGHGVATQPAPPQGERLLPQDRSRPWQPDIQPQPQQAPRSRAS